MEGSRSEAEPESDRREDHPNIVKCHGVYYERCFVCIVMDKFAGGDLVEGLQRHLKDKGQIPAQRPPGPAARLSGEPVWAPSPPSTGGGPPPCVRAAAAAARERMPVDDPNFLLKEPELARDYVDHMVNGKRRDEGVPAVDGSFFVGHEVEIQGLSARPELNGRRGQAVRLDPKTGRVGVDVEGCGTLALKSQQAALDGQATALRLALEPELTDLRIALLPGGKQGPQDRVELRPTAAEIVVVMKRCPENVLLQEQGCEALACFCKQAGGAGVVVAAMTAAKLSDIGVMRAGSRALANLANGDPACKMEVRRYGAVKLVVKAMKAHKQDLRLQHMSCALMANLANGDDDCQGEVVNAGGTAALVDALRLHASDAAIQGDGLLAIANLATGRQHGKDAICDADAVPVVVAALRKHAGDAKVQQWGLAALTNLANGDGECRQALCEGQGLFAMIEIMGRKRGDPDVQTMVCGALAHLARSEEYDCRDCRELILRLGGHKVVLAGMDAHPLSERVQEKGCYVLVQLAFSGASEKRAICDAGAAATLTRTLQNYPSVERLHSMASAILEEVLGWVHAHRLALGLRAAEAAAEVGKLDAGPGGTAAQLLFQLTPAGAQRGGGPPGSQRPAEQAVDFSGVLERRGVVRVRPDCPLQTIYCIFETCPHVQAVVSVEEAPLAVRALTRSLFQSHVLPAAERSSRAPAAAWPARPPRAAECGGASACAA
ncbi:unnamed protein product [Prorocentrum cordatum]|uniref:Armadillo repeat-containing protein 6 n=1 Tax=Prorocentrum cordatum TaxID=2364126 RepID=A0ABN9W9E4_9DINO|nr:unnamed protein product [Polarella glacialis]